MISPVKHLVVKKTFLKNHKNTYPVYMVDGSQLRKAVTLSAVKDTSKEHFDDFEDYGIRQDFPQIPPNEIWVANELDPKEIPIVIQVAERRLQLFAHEHNEKADYDASEQYNKDLRSKLIDIPTNRDPRIELYTTVGGVKVYIVDGFNVRNVYHTRFIQGGHHYVYPEIPENEIWLDNVLDEDEYLPVLVHEASERLLMKNERLSYEEAHAKATELEYQVREQEHEKGNKDAKA